MLVNFVSVKKKKNPKRGARSSSPWIRYRDPGKCSSGKFENLTPRQGDFLRFGAKWGHVLSRLWPQFRFRWPFKRNIVSPHAKTGPASQIVQGNCRAHFYSYCHKTQIRDETGGIHIFFEQFILLSVQKRTNRNESNVWACERVKKVLRRVTHAQGVCLGRSVSMWPACTSIFVLGNLLGDSFWPQNYDDPCSKKAKYTALITIQNIHSKNNHANYRQCGCEPHKEPNVSATQVDSLLRNNKPTHRPVSHLLRLNSSLVACKHKVCR